MRLSEHGIYILSTNVVLVIRLEISICAQASFPISITSLKKYNSAENLLQAIVFILRQIYSSRDDTQS